MVISNKLKLRTNLGRLFLLLAFCLISLSSCKQEGCTNIKATNYDKEADEDDGSCQVRGCTIQTANNFDSEATINDGSCTKDYVCTCTILGINSAIDFDDLTEEEADDAEADCTAGGICTWAEQ